MRHMVRTERFIPTGLVLWVAVLGSQLTRSVADDWPQFRGVGARGVGEGQNLPDSWDVETGTNVRWKTAIPGLGHACPVVSRACVFILSADNGEVEPELRLGLYGDIRSVSDDKPHEWQLLCLEQSTGKILWQRTLHRGVPAIKRHTKATHANTTPATDGKHVVVFLGSEGLYCLDFCGNVLWERDLGVLDSGYYRVPSAQWGFGSSPIIFRDMVILQCDVQEESFLAAFDIHTGRDVWRVGRDDVPTWSTPTIVEGPERIELVVNGFRHAGGYDPLTGKPFWRLGGGGDIPVPTPIFARGLIFLSSAHGSQGPLCAVRPGARGDLTPANGETSDESLAWYHRRAGIYMQTPIVYGDYLYACQDNGVLSCYEARTGERLYRERLGRATGFTASPVAADGKLYFTGETGVVHIVAAGPEYKLIASNEMGDFCMATPAIAGGLLIVRTQSHVYAIGNPPAQLATSSAPRSKTTYGGGVRSPFGHRLRSWWCRRLSQRAQPRRQWARSGRCRCR